MNTRAGIAVIGAVLGISQMAAADFSLSYTAQPDAPDAGHWRFEFYARNDGNHGSGRRLLTEDIELLCDQKMAVGTLANGDADVSGILAADFFNSDRSYINILGNPGDPENTYQDPSTPNLPAFFLVFTKPTPAQHDQWAGGSSDFRVVGSHLHATGIVADGTVNGGRGALIATAVVPTSATYVELIPWGLGGETGPAFGNFLGTADPPPQIGHLEPGGYNQLNAFTVAVPEPTVLALGTFATSVLLARTRRLVTDC